MTRLRDLQRNFMADCLSGQGRYATIVSTKDIVTRNISVKARMDIYRQNVLGNITGAMELTYPVVLSLVGREFFRATVGQYLHDHWPVSADMDEYGGQFSAFLEVFEPAKELTYLPDVACLEWKFHESSIADDATLGDWQNISDLGGEELMAIRIKFVPSVQFLSSDYPIVKIWEMCQATAEQDTQLDLERESGSHILLVRKQLKVGVYAVEHSEYTFLQSLYAGKTLYESYEAAVNISDEFLLQEMLRKHVDIGTFSDFY